MVSTELACLRPEGGAPSDAGLDATTGAEAEAGDDAPGAADVATTDVDANSSEVEAGGDAEPESGVDAVLPPSCAPGGPGLSNCGPGGSGTESCCTSLEVTGGTYYRTYDQLEFSGNAILAADGGPTGEADPATVSSFRLDKYLVTVGRFRQFVRAWNAGYLPPAGSGKHAYLNGGQGLANSGTPGTYEPGWVATDDSNIAPTNANLVGDASGVSACDEPGFATWTNSTGSQENLPINCVNWYESYAFCIWDGGFLPSEAEWEFAAAGGNQQREYPWGSTAPGTANQYAIYGGEDYEGDEGYEGCYYPSGTLAPCTGVTNIAPVGTAPLGAGLWGRLDLAGDLFEWNLDWVADYTVCADCADVTAGGDRVLRGGNFGDFASSLLPPLRGIYYPPATRVVIIGFRCSRTP
jgi:formylglycine-generating enzyme required for sulfatase activity